MYHWASDSMMIVDLTSRGLELHGLSWVAAFALEGGTGRSESMGAVVGTSGGASPPAGVAPPGERVLSSLRAPWAVQACLESRGSNWPLGKPCAARAAGPQWAEAPAAMGNVASTAGGGAAKAQPWQTLCGS